MCFHLVSLRLSPRLALHLGRGRSDAILQLTGDEVGRRDIGGWARATEQRPAPKTRYAVECNQQDLVSE